MDTVWVIIKWNELGSDCAIFDSWDKAFNSYKTEIIQLKELYEECYKNDKIVIHEIPTLLMRQCIISKLSKASGNLEPLKKITLVEEQIF